jgi:hypothetical protein
LNKWIESMRIVQRQLEDAGLDAGSGIARVANRPPVSFKLAWPEAPR